MMKPPWLRLALPLLIIFSAMLFASGCPYAVSVPGDKLAPTEETVAEIVPGSLKVEVTTYGIELRNSKSHIRIFGEVVNNTGAPIQGVTLNGTLHDSRGQPVAFGSSFVAPSYLPAGGKGTFEFVGLLKRSSHLEATRLVTLSKQLSAY
ncbi:MAG: hypothetical protein LBE49_02020 [Deltaproteobacteria bacterium]|jgi:hypothetical protein|nr:hypothetical protein [Deltaproteobacteria bacterium]